MSLILEALKKSEQQRQREKAPSLQSIHQPVTVAIVKAGRPWWLLAVFVLICNFAFFGYWFWRQQNTATKVQVEPAARPEATVAPLNAQSAAQPDNANQPIAAQEGSNRQNSQSEFTQISPRGAATQSAPVDSAQRVEEINELPENIRNNLPAMTFSFHVYSENPEQRTIIINDRRVREGEEVSAGLRLQAITQDGVILLFEQHRIHISVLSDW